MINTCHKHSFLVLHVLSVEILETIHKCTTLFSIDLAWIFHHFCVMVFVLFPPVKKKSRLNLSNFRVISLIFVSVFQLCSYLHSRFAKMNSTKTSKELQIVWFEDLWCILRLILLKVSVENFLFPKNYFYIFLSLPVSWENKLLIVYYVPRS